LLIIISFSHPILAFIAFANGVIADYARARLSLIVKESGKNFPYFPNQFHRIFLLGIGIVVNFAAPTIFGFNALKMFLIIAILFGFFSFVQNFIFSERRILVAEKNDTLLECVK
jgi:hypothetical protein